MIVFYFKVYYAKCIPTFCTATIAIRPIGINNFSLCYSQNSPQHLSCDSLPHHYDFSGKQIRRRFLVLEPPAPCQLGGNFGKGPIVFL